MSNKRQQLQDAATELLALLESGAEGEFAKAFDNWYCMSIYHPNGDEPEWSYGTPKDLIDELADRADCERYERQQEQERVMLARLVAGDGISGGGAP